jgi:hypothetical protein
MEDALIEVPTMRRFVGIDLVSEHIPDETTILAFLSADNEVGRRFASINCYPLWLTPGSTGISPVSLPCIPGIGAVAAAVISCSIHCSR